MTNITELAQRLKAAAEKATPGPWYVHDKPCEDGNYGIDTSDKEFLAEAVVWWGFARQSIWREEDAKYIALANPVNILALVEALEYYKSREERVTSLVRDNSKSWDELYRQVEAKGKRNVELVEALETEKRICATWRKTAESTSEKLEKAQAAERRWHRVASRVHEQACESDVKIDELEAIRAAAEKLVRCKGRYHSEQNYRALADLFGVTTPDLPLLGSESRTVKLPDGWQFEECEMEGCENGAIFSVGTGSRNIHLCDKCAHEPQNSRLKKSPLPKRLPFKMSAGIKVEAE